jgi:dihydroorotase
MIIKNARIYTKDSEKTVDILIDSGKIQKISDRIDINSHEIIDIKEMSLLPGIVDLNVRVRDDKLNPKNLENLSKKAIRSGVTTFVLNSYDGLESGTTIELLSEMLKNFIPDIFLTISGTNSEKRLNDIAILINNGAKVIKDHSDIDSNLIRRLMEYAVLKNTPMFWFCEDDTLNGNASMNDGRVSSNMGLPGNIKIGEISEVAKIVEFIKFYKAKTLLQTLSSSEAVEVAKSQDIDDLFVELAIHNLILDQSSCEQFNTYAKLRPPLRCEDQKNRLKTLLKSGKIDTLTSSHSPKSVLYKDVAFEDAKFGVDSLEIFFSLCYTHLVKSDVIDMYTLQKLISLNPSKIVGFSDIGQIKEGYKADLIVVDTEKEYIVDHIYSPYYDMKLSAKISKTIKNGVCVSL